VVIFYNDVAIFFIVIFFLVMNKRIVLILMLSIGLFLVGCQPQNGEEIVKKDFVVETQKVSSFSKNVTFTKPGRIV